MPSEIQRRAPFTTLPTCGISTATSSTNGRHEQPGRHFSQVAMGT
jgi:hypothetical protein